MINEIEDYLHTHAMDHYLDELSNHRDALWDAITCEPVAKALDDAGIEVFKSGMVVT